MNPHLARLRPYPFEKLRALVAGVTPNAAFNPVDLSIGEPKHAAPELVKRALAGSLDGLSSYPATAGMPALREAIAAWLQYRYALPALDPSAQVMPVNGAREALFAFAQAMIDPAGGRARVACPNPFYQIYEGAALLAGAEPVFLNATEASGHRMQFDDLAATAWPEVKLLYACSPANPGGMVLRLEDWQRLFESSDRHGFAIASDECYSELYYDEAKPPLGALQAAHLLGREGYLRLVVFSSLSERSNVPGMRSGFVAGDPGLLKAFLLYRTYHGSAMSPPVQQASIAAWRDQAHVRENRRLYAEKYRALLPLAPPQLHAYLPEGGFCLWLRTPVDDCEFARTLQRDYNVRVLPGSYLGRDAHGENPGAGYVRLALVAPLADCVDAFERTVRFASQL